MQLVDVDTVGGCDPRLHRIAPLDPAVPSMGRVEVRDPEGRWGLVCDDFWTDLTAAAFCACLGYTRQVLHGFLRDDFKYRECSGGNAKLEEG